MAHGAHFTAESFGKGVRRDFVSENTLLTGIHFVVATRGVVVFHDEEEFVRRVAAASQATDGRNLVRRRLQVGRLRSDRATIWRV